MSLKLYASSRNYSQILERPPPVSFECILKENIYWTYCLPSVFIEVWLVYRLFDFRKFRMRPEFATIFYVFLLQFFIVHLHTFVVDVIFERLAQTGVYFSFLVEKRPIDIIRFYLFLREFGFAVCKMSAFTLSLARFLTVSWPDFLPQHCPVVVACLAILQYSFSIVPHWFIAFDEPFFFYDNRSSCPVVYFGSEQVLPWVLNNSQLAIDICALASAAFILVITYRDLKKSARDARSPYVQQIEKSGTRITSVIFFCASTGVIMDAIKVLVEPSIVLYFITKLIWDLTFFSLAWIFAFSHPNFRFALFCIRPCCQSTRILPSVDTVSTESTTL